MIRNHLVDFFNGYKADILYYTFYLQICIQKLNEILFNRYYSSNYFLPIVNGNYYLPDLLSLSLTITCHLLKLQEQSNLQSLG